ncbi:MAG: NADH-quinone oxidoreductase subunit C [Acidobacteriota bacterium]|nr:NADH-quinone oxidoreductase subunit C [Acidobacteriota bacterium]
MTTLETIPSELAVTTSWESKGGSQWLASDALEVRKMAEVMMAHQGRLLTITATQLPEDGGMTLDYHWDLDGTLLTFAFVVENNQVASIFDLCEAADWIEREIHEHYGIEVTGREYEPLLLRAGDKMGVNLHEEED